MGDYSFEDFPIMLETIMSKKNVNHLSRMHINVVVNIINLWIITREGTQIRDDKVKNNNIVLRYYEHPNTKMHKQKFNHATQVLIDLEM